MRASHTMVSGGGVGLAAPQVGVPLQLAVLEDRPELLEWMSEARRAELERSPFPCRVLINPTIENVGDRRVEAFEGCLSVAGWVAVVPRWHTIRVQAVDEHGESVDDILSGWPARIVQHEVDHLQGCLYLDRMLSRTFTSPPNLGRYWYGRPIDEVKKACRVTEQ